VEILGLDPVRHPLEVRRRVGYVPDAVGFYDGMTGRQNLRLTGRLNGLAPGEMESRIDDVLEQVGLSAAADIRVQAYSRGMRQRLGIADALVKSPLVLILDEPTAAIDPEGVEEILRLIRWLSEEQGVTVMLSSHQLHQVQSVCDRVAIFVEGKVVGEGAPYELGARWTGPEVFDVTVLGVDPGRIMALPRVGTVEAGRRPNSFRITVDPGSGATMVRGLVELGGDVVSVHRLGDDLDEVYRRFFSEEVARV
jgi:ABC-2 type transport system ATP-binding protein